MLLLLHIRVAVEDAAVRDDILGCPIPVFSINWKTSPAVPTFLPDNQRVFAVANESSYRDGSVECLCLRPHAFPQSECVCAFVFVCVCQDINRAAPPPENGAKG